MYNVTVTAVEFTLKTFPDKQAFWLSSLDEQVLYFRCWVSSKYLVWIWMILLHADASRVYKSEMNGFLLKQIYTLTFKMNTWKGAD